MKQPRVTTMPETRPAPRDELTIFDLETGGFKRSHPTIQVAAITVDVALEGWPEVETIERKVKFDHVICEPKALELNSYDPEVWAREAIPAAQVRQDLEAFFKRHQTLQLIGKPKGGKPGRPYSLAKLGGHNVASFDMPRLVRLWGADFPPFCHWRPLDTLRLADWVFGCGRHSSRPENHKLPTLCAFFDIDPGQSHDALADARATVQLAQKLLALQAELGIGQRPE
jgi:DNA polymerase III epsilon subunit-like protein